MERVEKIVANSIEVARRLSSNMFLLQTIAAVADKIADAYVKGNKVLAAGNGGSAADAQHFIAEFVGRFYYDRPALPGIALTTDTSVLTAIGNDYGYEDIFARQVEANGKKGDVLLAISTSGNSANIIKALNKAKEMGLLTVGLTGSPHCKMDSICDYIIKAPTDDTPRVQEIHLLVEHTICELVEKKLFPKNK